MHFISRSLSLTRWALASSPSAGFECGGPIRTLEVIHCGVDTTVFHPIPRATVPSAPLQILAIGTLHEVNATGTLLQSWTFPNSFGYIEKRATLYGPPPR